MRITPYTISVSDDAIEDLRARLTRARLPDEINDPGWGWGTDRGFLDSVVTRWRDDFDWRAHEARLNSYPQFLAELDGTNLHFVHVRSPLERTVPLLLSHGWPGSFVEMLGMIPLLTGPSEITERVGIGFDVVVPSLPGFGFSDRPASAGTSSEVVAGMLHRLMTGLGYERYAVQGGDLGAGISLRLARGHPESVIGAHVNFPAFVWGGPSDDSDAGKAADRAREDWLRREGAYSHQHSTRPQTLGYALNDSPVGLAAWVLEKFHGWSDRSRSGDELPFDLDELLTNISVYWFTETITSSMRIYREGAADPLVLGPDQPLRVPVGVADFPFEIDTTQPRERVAAVADLRRWTRFDRGGHFAALEQPLMLAEDVATFVAELVDRDEAPEPWDG